MLRPEGEITCYQHDTRRASSILKTVFIRFGCPSRGKICMSTLYYSTARVMIVNDVDKLDKYASHLSLIDIFLISRGFLKSFQNKTFTFSPFQQL